MPIYFGNNFAKEPFQFDSVGNNWEQESVNRPNGFPLFHYLQTQKGTGIINIYYKDELSLVRLAEIFGYSPSYLSRMFQKYAKINYKTYLQDIRMAYAYRDLMNTDRTISQIALDNGFCSSRGFSGEFQKRYGILPSEMRKQENQKGQKNAIE